MGEDVGAHLRNTSGGRPVTLDRRVARVLRELLAAVLATLADWMLRAALKLTKGTRRDS